MSGFWAPLSSSVPERFDSKAKNPFKRFLLSRSRNCGGGEREEFPREHLSSTPSMAARSQRMQSPAEAEGRGWQGEGADHMDVSLLVQDHDPSNPRSQDYGDDENDGEDDGSLTNSELEEEGSWCERAASVFYQLLYLATGGLCFWAATVHGPNFCLGVASDVDDAEKLRSYVGPDGLVVRWLRVESIFAIFIPVAPVVLRLCCRSRKSWVVGITLCLSIIQTGLFALGCALTIGGSDGGGLVPKECWSGELGDATAYWLIRYISVAWIGMISFTAAMTWIIGCHQLFVVRVAWVKAKRRLVERGALPQRGAGGAAFEADTAGGQRA